MLTVCEGLMDARVLVVDDEADIRRVVADVLESGGAIVECAASGEEGIERCDVRSYDLHWIDLRLPGMDGLAFLKSLRARSPSAKAVLMTAYGDCAVYIDAMALGAAAMVRKPFTARQILSVSEGALKQD